jgi:hypothetical protein
LASNRKRGRGSSWTVAPTAAAEEEEEEEEELDLNVEYVRKQE